MTTFKEVQNLYWGCPIQTKDGIFPLIMYIDGEYLLDKPFYGFGAVEQDCKPILKDLADITDEDCINLLSTDNILSEYVIGEKGD